MGAPSIKLDCQVTHTSALLLPLIIMACLLKKKTKKILLTTSAFNYYLDGNRKASLALTTNWC